MYYKYEKNVGKYEKKINPHYFTQRDITYMTTGTQSIALGKGIALNERIPVIVIEFSDWT